MMNTMNMSKISTTKYIIVMLPPLLFTMWSVYCLWSMRKNQTLVFEYQREMNQVQAHVEGSGEELLMVNLVQIHSRNVTHAPLDTLREYQAPAVDIKLEEMAICPEGEKLVGPVYVNQELIPKIQELEKAFSLSYGGWVENGGAWKPQHCQPKRKLIGTILVLYIHNNGYFWVKVAIIIPYRNRYEQLKMFLRQIHPILKRQLLDYRIFIVEQEGNMPFNRAILFNIGFNESLAFGNYQCFIFHDVDLLPEDDRNLYSCPSSPRHMCPAIDKFFYRLAYEDLFGGVEAFTREHFEKINGFSNKYWGWGGEDDDLRRRIHHNGMRLTRPRIDIGRYKMVKKYHHSDTINNQRYELLENALDRIHHDGLNSLRYKLLKTVNNLLYTHLVVRVDPKLV